MVELLGSKTTDTEGWEVGAEIAPEGVGPLTFYLLWVYPGPKVVSDETTLLNYYFSVVAPFVKC